MQPEYIKGFLEKYAAGTCSDEEHQQFKDWLVNAPMEDLERIAEEYKVIAERRSTPGLINTDIVSQIEAALDQYDLGNNRQQPLPGKLVSLMRYRKIAAAAIILLFGTGVYFAFFSTRTQKVIAENNQQVIDIAAPHTTKAYITLADGSTIFLDSVPNGSLATLENVKVIKTGEGSVSYQGETGAVSTDISFHTLTVPKGSKPVNLVLADGSQVWLDAATTIIYPTVFTGNQRRIELVTGQSYFEVAHNSAMPFLVKKGDSEIEVLGTHFNVNAYDDEAVMKVTLLEGSVALSRKPQGGTRERIVIRPGEQGQFAQRINIVKGTDVEAVMAWKNGLFNFNHSDLQMVLRQLSRWYDVEVVYQGVIPKRNFGGEMQRDLNLSEVLKLLEKNKVNFKIEGKKLIVSP